MKTAVISRVEERKISEARMFLTSGYVLNACVPVKPCFLHTFRSDFSQKSWTFLSLGWHVRSDFRRDVLLQRVL